MTNRVVLISIFLLLGSLINELKGMDYENRFIPLIPRTYSRTWRKPSHVNADFFFLIGNDAFGHTDDTDEDVGIFEICGQYDENQEASSIVQAGISPTNPLDTMDLSQFIGKKLLWTMDGKIEAQGVSFQWDQQILPYVWVGGTWFFMHLYARNAFPSLTPLTIDQFHIDLLHQERLDQVRREMNQMIGVVPAVWNESGFSDVDAYIRFGGIWEYLYKFKRIDAGARLGVIMPSGVIRDPNNPASIPFGDNGFWGVYAAVDTELELKEDWIVGCLLRVNQRFARTHLERFPINEEQPLYGVLTGNMLVEPGATFIFSPYAALENIRNGLNLQVQYTLIVHSQDTWTDKRPVPSPAPAYDNFIGCTSWRSEYLTLNGWLDIAQMRSPSSFAPLVSLKWDIPVRIIAAKRAAKTNRIAVGIQWLF